MKTNTEPVATTRTAELMARQFDEARKLKDGLPREEIAAAWIDLAMKLESALQVERERADEAEKREMSRYQQYSALLERHEKQTAELAALKEALRNPTDDMVSSGLITARETGEITEVFKAMTANLLKD